MPILTKKKVKVLNTPVYTPLPTGTYSTPIPFRSDLIFFDAPAYTNDDSGIALTAANLAVTTGLVNINGVTAGVPPTGGMGIDMYGYKVLDWISIGGSWKVNFDLQGEWDLDYAYIYVTGQENNGGVAFGASQNGTDYTTISVNQSVNQGSWLLVPFNNTTGQASAKYFQMQLATYTIVISGLVLYGRRTGNKLISGTKLSKNVPLRNFEHTTGTNAFWIEKPQLLSDVSGSHRFYIEYDWYLGNNWRGTGTAIGHNPNELDMRFSSSQVINIDQALQGCANEGSKVLFTMVGNPIMLRSLGTNDARHCKPVDPGLSPNVLANTTNPMNYKWMARLCWHVAARYGNNPLVDQSLIMLDQTIPQNVEVGLNLIYAMEMGNEDDSWFTSAGGPGYFNPEELAAYMSAIYDGHKGAMGAGFGIKTADPSMKVCIPSLAAGDNTPYIRKMLFWFDKNRGIGDYPFDIIGYHYYNSSEGSQEVGDDTAVGVQPESGKLIAVNNLWAELRNTYCPTKELWITEVGYDEQLGGVFSPNYPTQFLRSRHKAYWLTRLFLINEICGIDVTNQYWYATTGGPKLSDYSNDEPNAGKFLTSGLVEGIQDTTDLNRAPLMSYWYVAALRKTLLGYKFEHTVMTAGISAVDENLIVTTDSNLYASAYTNWIAGKNYLVIWLGSASMRTLSVSINTLTSTATSVKLVTNDNLEITQSTVGITTQLPVINGQITLTVTECPQFIELDNIGTPSILQPTNITTQKLTNGTDVLIAWTDSNLFDVYANISASSTLTGVYSTIYQGSTNGAEYLVKNLTVGSTYYFKVNLVPNTSEIIQPTTPVDPGNPSIPGFPDVDSAFFIPNSVEIKYFKNNYYGGYGYKLGTTSVLAVDGESFSQYPDTIGTVPMNYIGLTNPTMTGVPPLKSRHFTVYENRPDTNSESAAYTGLQVPYEHHLIIASAPSSTYEGFTPGGGNRGYIGDGGYTNRIINSSYGYISSGGVLPKLKLSYIRLVVRADASADFYLNGTFVANLPFQADDLTAAQAGQFLKTLNGIGVNTNVAEFWFGQLGFVDHQLTTNEANELYTSLNNKWTTAGYGFGAYVTDVVTDNITLVWNYINNVLVPDVSSIRNLSTTKTLKDPSQWIYKWYTKSDAVGYHSIVLVGTTYQLANNAYPANNGTTIVNQTVKFTVQPVFTDGTVEAVPISGTFVNVPAGTGS